MRPVEQSEKADSCRENFWNEIQFQTKQDRMRIFEEILFFKATYDTKTNKSLILCQLDPCGRKRARDSRTKKKRDEGWAVLFEATQRRQDELCVMWRNICIQIIPADVIICHETGHCPWTVPATPCRHVTCTCTLRNGRVSGGFFFAWKDFGRMFDNLFPACAFFLFFFKVGISSRTRISLFTPQD